MKKLCLAFIVVLGLAVAPTLASYGDTCASVTAENVCNESQQGDSKGKVTHSAHCMCAHQLAIKSPALGVSKPLMMLNPITPIASDTLLDSAGISPLLEPPSHA